MAACNFTFPIPGDPNTILDKARSAVEGQGGTFQGNDQAGAFSLSAFGQSIAGNYAITGQQMDIIISDKPFLLPCGTIEGYLKSQLGL